MLPTLNKWFEKNLKGLIKKNLDDQINEIKKKNAPKNMPNKPFLEEVNNIPMIIKKMIIKLIIFLNL